MEPNRLWRWDSFELSLPTTYSAFPDLSSNPGASVVIYMNWGMELSKIAMALALPLRMPCSLGQPALWARLPRYGELLAGVRQVQALVYHLQSSQRSDPFPFLLISVLLFRFSRASDVRRRSRIGMQP